MPAPARCLGPVRQIQPWAGTEDPTRRGVHAEALLELDRLDEAVPIDEQFFDEGNDNHIPLEVCQRKRL